MTRKNSKPLEVRNYLDQEKQEKLQKRKKKLKK